MKVFLYIICLTFLTCQDAPEGEVVAEAYGNKLYTSEIDELMSDNISFEDSVFISKEYVDLWIKRQVLLAKSQTVLSEKERDKNTEMRNYRNDLLMYETLNKIALSKIDTSVTIDEIEEYYEAHSDEFQLAQNIIQVNFFRVPLAFKNLESYWTKFRNNENEITSLLKKEADKRGWSYYIGNGDWVYFDDILKEIPINTYNQEHYLNNNKYIRINDGDFVYFVKIIDFKTTSNTAPLQVEKENIKNTILLQRQQEMIKKVETELLSEAYNSNKVTLY